MPNRKVSISSIGTSTDGNRSATANRFSRASRACRDTGGAALLSRSWTAATACTPRNPLQRTREVRSPRQAPSCTANLDHVGASWRKPSQAASKGSRAPPAVGFPVELLPARVCCHSPGALGLPPARLGHVGVDVVRRLVQCLLGRPAAPD